MVDLTTTYLGLKLKNPLVPSSSPLMRWGAFKGWGSRAIEIAAIASVHAEHLICLEIEKA